MAKRQATNPEQAYHELLGDMQQLLLLQDFIPLPLSVDPLFGIIWGVVEALVTDLAGRCHVDIADVQRTVAQLRHNDEIDWRALEAVVTGLAGRIPDVTATAQLAGRHQADLDRRAANAVSTLRLTFADAVDAAKAFEGLDRNHPLWLEAYEVSGRLQTALRDIQAHSAMLMRLAGHRAQADSGRRRAATPPPRSVRPITPAPRPASTSRTGSRLPGVRRAASSHPARGYHNPGSSSGMRGGWGR